MLFSQERVKNGFKNGFKIAQGAVPIYQEGVGLKIMHSKIELTVRRVEYCFPGRDYGKNQHVKNSVNGTEGTVLFSNERVRP